MSSAAASARGHATCPCCQVCLRAPPTSWSFKHFPGKNEVADVSVSLGTLPRSPATGRRAPTSLGVPPVPPRPRTRGRARDPRDRRRCPPPSPPPPVADRAPLDPRRTRALFAAYPKSLTERGTDVSFVPNAPRSRTPCLRDTPRRAPTARWCARHATATALRARRWTLERLRGAHERARADVAARCAGAKRREKRVARPPATRDASDGAPRRASELRRGCAKK